MKTNIIYLALAAFFSACFSLAAIAQNNILYDALVSVEERSEAARQAAFRDALSEVFVKVSGQSSTLTHAQVKATLQNASELAERYEYRTIPSISPDQPPGLGLLVSFQSNRVDDVLRSANLPIWGKDRPLPLAWVLLSEDNQTRIINSDDLPMAYGALSKRSDQRGIPMVFPLLDIDDRLALNTRQLQQFEHTSIQQASQRYVPDAILAGHVFPTALDSSVPAWISCPDSLLKAGQWADACAWQGQWWLYLGEDKWHWAYLKKERDDILAQGVDFMTNTLAQRFAEPEAPPETLEVTIHGVSTLGDYATVQKYLRELGVVLDMQILEISSNRMKVQLKARGGESALARAISLGYSLEPRGLMREGIHYQLLR
ncbi:MAG: DUF2066 domain-containing protein [Pseudomonadota bacterium]